MSENDSGVVNHLQRQLDENDILLSPSGKKVLHRLDFDHSNYVLSGDTGTLSVLCEFYEALHDELESLPATRQREKAGMALPVPSKSASDAILRLYGMETAQEQMQSLIYNERGYAPKPQQQVAFATIEKTMPLAFRQRQIDLAMQVERSFSDIATVYRELQVQHVQALGKEGVELLGDLAQVCGLIAMLSKQHMQGHMRAQMIPPLP